LPSANDPRFRLQLIQELTAVNTARVIDLKRRPLTLLVMTLFGVSSLLSANWWPYSQPKSGRSFVELRPTSPKAEQRIKQYNTASQWRPTQRAFVQPSPIYPRIERQTQMRPVGSDETLIMPPANPRLITRAPEHSQFRPLGRSQQERSWVTPNTIGQAQPTRPVYVPVPVWIYPASPYVMPMMPTPYWGRW
jgi:hypothetical protein